MASQGQDRVRTDAAFAIIPEWLLDADCSPLAVRLFGILHRYADTAGECYPKRKTLASRLRVSVRTVDRSMDELAAVGAVVVEPRYNSEGDQDSNLYTLRMTDPLVTGVATPGHELPEGVVTADQRVGSGVTRQEREPLNETQGTRTPPPPAAGLSAKELAKKITDDWWLWRKEMTGKEPLQPYMGVRSIVTRAVKAGHDDNTIRRALAAVTGDGGSVTYHSLSKQLATAPRSFHDVPDEAYQAAL